MQTVLIVVHLLIVVALIAVVLLQRSEGGALGMGGGGAGSFFTGRGQANALTRATAILATLFFITSLALTILASYNHPNKSIFESPAATAPASATDQPKGTVLDQLKQMEKTAPAAPAAPPAPEPAQAPPRSQ
ncbi:preprotein translocase subunit SecG [Rhodoblastus sp.]|uniref:preprotein translocase subunit SecG n=1 Tax=Rhodoblastus sp. TaxID=1962975 RepID=UPI0035B0C27D